jgi:hypothetical protein
MCDAVVGCCLTFDVEQVIAEPNQLNQYRIQLTAKPKVQIKWGDVHFSVSNSPLQNHRLHTTDFHAFEFCCVSMDVKTEQLKYFFTYEGTLIRPNAFALLGSSSPPRLKRRVSDDLKLVGGVITDTRIFVFPPPPPPVPPTPTPGPTPLPSAPTQCVTAEVLAASGVVCGYIADTS